MAERTKQQVRRREQKIMGVIYAKGQALALEQDLQSGPLTGTSSYLVLSGARP